MKTLTKQSIFFEILKYIFFFFLFVVLQFAQINGLRPFAFGMLFALVWCNQKIFVVAPMYVATSLIVSFQLQDFLCAICTVFVFVLFFALHYKFKKPLNKIFIGLYAFLSQALFFYFNTYSLDAFLNAVCHLVIGLVCMYAYLFFMQSLLLRGLRRKYSVDEMLCAGVLFLALGAGIESLPYFYVSKAIFVFLALVLSFVFSTSSSLSFSLLLGVGSLFSSMEYNTFLFLTLLAIVLCLTKNSLPIFAVLGAIFVDCFENFYFFSTFEPLLFLPTVIAGLLFLILSKKTLKKIKVFVIAENEDFSARFFINKSKEKLSKKLLDTSNLFLAMQNTFVSMTKTGISPTQAVSFVSKEAKKQICVSCPKFDVCFKNHQGFEAELQTLSALALSRGNLGMFDLPSNLGANCLKSKLFVQRINAIANEYQNFCVTKNSVDSSRMMIANELFGVSKILKSLSCMANTKIVFNIEKEEMIKEELLLNQILCSEVLLNFSEQELCDTTLIVKNKDVNPPLISKIVSKILGKQMELKNVEDSSKSGFSALTLIPKVFFDVVFGCCGALKNGSSTSGDNHLVFRICEDKVMMALCDGMGSGKNASKVSDLALELIEKFYKAGFDTNLILENVNAILSLRDEENFGALDVCVFDLKLCACDVLKLGAPVGFLKQKQETKIIQAGSLPLGILKDVNPNLKSFALNDGDMIILVTDGVVDAIGNLDYLKTAINNFKSKNPQQLADMILKICLEKCNNKAPDDMTVLVGKIWQKI